MAAKSIGKIIHYFDKIQVAVVKMTGGDLKLGDEVKLISKEGKEFTQEVVSMQIEHANIEIAKKGDEFGLKIEGVPKVPSPIVKV